MKRGTSAKSSLFLLEMMISILFFAIAAAVCMQVFVKTQLRSQAAEDLNMAQSCAASAAEQLVTELRAAQTAAAYAVRSDMTQTDTTDAVEMRTVWYDRDWLPCGEETAAYRMTVEAVVEDDVCRGEIRVCTLQGKEEKRELYCLTTATYVPQPLERKVTRDE